MILQSFVFVPWVGDAKNDFGSVWAGLACLGGCVVRVFICCFCIALNSLRLHFNVVYSLLCVDTICVLLFSYCSLCFMRCYLLLIYLNTTYFHAF